MDGLLEFQSAWMDRRVADARSMFNRVLVNWAGDVLELRRTNRMVPAWRDGGDSPDRQADPPIEPMNEAA